MGYFDLLLGQALGGAKVESIETQIPQERSGINPDLAGILILLGGSAILLFLVFRLAKEAK